MDTFGQPEHAPAAPQSCPSRVNSLEPYSEQDLSLGLLPRKRMYRRLVRFLQMTVFTQVVVSAVVLLALQGPWRGIHSPDHGQSLVALTVERLRNQPFLVHHPTIQKDLDELAALPSVVFSVVVDGDGRMLMSGGDANPDPKVPRLSESSHRSYKVGMRRHVNIARNLVVFESRMPDELGNSRYLLVGVRDLGAQRAVLDGVVALLIGTLAASLISVPFAIARFRWWTKGLHDLHAAIRRLTLGAPLEPVAVGGDNEVAYLSIAFNDMAGRLNASQRELVLANRSLERRVAERTEELRIANARLERQNVQLGELSESALRFTDDVAHEFRTPLAVIMEFASIMSDGIGGEISEEQSGYLDFIAAASRDLAGMVDDFLDSGKLRARCLPVHRCAQHVDQIIDAIWPMLQTRAAHAGVELYRDIDPDTPVVYVDGKMVGRAIVNLVVNAIKFSPEDARVTIKARSEGLGVRVSVIDQGPGLTEVEVNALFSRFKQTSSGRDSTSKGFGLGLNIVKELITINLGEVGVQSATGKGSIFSFTLPPDDPEVIIDMFLHRLRTLASNSRIGVIRVGRETRGPSDERLIRFLTSVIQPLDIRISLLDERSQLLVGETRDLEAWCNRLRRAATDSHLLQEDDRGLIVIEEAVLCTLDDAKEVILSCIYDSDSERKAAA